MPHDKHGHELHVGDTVLVPCKVKSVNPGVDWCNVGLETVEPMPPGTTHTPISLNTAQVEWAPSLAQTDNSQPRRAHDIVGD